MSRLKTGIDVRPGVVGSVQQSGGDLSESCIKPTKKLPDRGTSVGVYGVCVTNSPSLSVPVSATFRRAWEFFVAVQNQVIGRREALTSVDYVEDLLAISLALANSEWVILPSGVAVHVIVVCIIDLEAIVVPVDLDEAVLCEESSLVALGRRLALESESLGEMDQRCWI